MLALLLVPDAVACAGMLVATATSTGQLASSDAQQAILSRGDGSVSAEYRVRYSGDASDFGWVIPVPGANVVVEEGSEERFVTIEDATAPTVTTYTVESDDDGHSRSGCFACSTYSLDGSEEGGLENGRGGDLGGSTGVAIVGTGYAGAFEYSVIEAEDAAGFLEWLEAEGYDTSVSGDVIAEYVAEDVGWVVARIRPDVAVTPEGGVLLNPLRVTWEGTELVYPARMAKASMLAEVRTELYVLGDSYTEPGNGWTYTYTEDGDFDVNGVAGDDPEALYAEMLGGVGGSVARMYAVWAGEYTDAVAGSAFLVRYDTIVQPAANATDVTFLENGATWSFSTVIGLREVEEPASTALLVPFTLFSVAWSRRRRR